MYVLGLILGGSFGGGNVTVEDINRGHKLIFFNKIPRDIYSEGNCKSLELFGRNWIIVIVINKAWNDVCCFFGGEGGALRQTQL